MNLNINNPPPSQILQFSAAQHFSEAQKMYGMSHTALSQLAQSVPVNAATAIGDSPTQAQMDASGRALADLTTIENIANQIATYEAAHGGNAPPDLANLQAEALNAANDLMTYQGKVIPQLQQLLFTGVSGGPSSGMDRSFTLNSSGQVTAINFTQFNNDFTQPSSPTNVGFVQLSMQSNPPGFFNPAFDIGSWTITGGDPDAALGFVSYFAAMSLSTSVSSGTSYDAIWGEMFTGAGSTLLNLGDLFPMLIFANLYSKDSNDPQKFIKDLQSAMNSLPAPGPNMPNYTAMYNSLAGILNYYQTTPTADALVPPPGLSPSWLFILNSGSAVPFGQPANFSDFYQSQIGDIFRILFYPNSSTLTEK